MESSVEKYHLRSTTTVSNIQISGDPHYRYYIFDRMHQDVVHKLVVERTKETKHDYSTTFDLDVYVFNPEDFWEIVQREAMNIHQRMTCSNMEIK